MTFEEFKREWEGPQDYIEVHTSGSTGIPKKIHLRKNFVRDSALRTIKFFNLNNESHLYSCVGAEFIGGKMMAIRALIAESNFSYEEPSNRILINYKSVRPIDLLAVVPSQVIFLLDNISTLPSIKNLIIGGSSIHPTLRKRISDSGLNAYETYGMTETASHIALRKVTEEEQPFKLLPGIEIVTDDEGCLKIMFDSGEVVQTNDQVEIISENEFFVKGRRDNMIISGGRKINPFEIEKKVLSLINSDFYFTSLPDEKWGEKLVLVIEGTDDSLDKTTLKRNLDKILTTWERPKEIILIKNLKRTANGKIQRIKPIL